jgi:hypothetical protein
MIHNTPVWDRALNIKQGGSRHNYGVLEILRFGGAGVSVVISSIDGIRIE